MSITKSSWFHTVASTWSRLRGTFGTTTPIRTGRLTHLHTVNASTSRTVVNARIVDAPTWQVLLQPVAADKPSTSFSLQDAVLLPTSGRTIHLVTYVKGLPPRSMRVRASTHAEAEAWSVAFAQALLQAQTEQLAQLVRLKREAFAEYIVARTSVEQLHAIVQTLAPDLDVSSDMRARPLAFLLHDLIHDRPLLCDPWLLQTILKKFIGLLMFYYHVVVVRHQWMHPYIGSIACINALLLTVNLYKIVTSLPKVYHWIRNRAYISSAFHQLRKTRQQKLKEAMTRHSARQRKEMQKQVQAKRKVTARTRAKTRDGATGTAKARPRSGRSVRRPRGLVTMQRP